MTQPTFTSTPSEASPIEAAVRTTIDRLSATWGKPELAAPGAETDLFEALDSFAIVELLMETESEVERSIGRYVPLANEKILDSALSPLRQYRDWVAYVVETVERG
jgi:acyl carrier protein